MAVGRLEVGRLDSNHLRRGFCANHDDWHLALLCLPRQRKKAVTAVGLHLSRSHTTERTNVVRQLSPVLLAHTREPSVVIGKLLCHLYAGVIPVREEVVATVEVWPHELEDNKCWLGEAKELSTGVLQCLCSHIWQYVDHIASWNRV